MIKVVCLLFMGILIKRNTKKTKAQASLHSHFEWLLKGTSVFPQQHLGLFMCGIFKLKTDLSAVTISTSLVI